MNSIGKGVFRPWEPMDKANYYFRSVQLRLYPIYPASVYIYEFSYEKRGDTRQGS